MLDILRTVPFQLLFRGSLPGVLTVLAYLMADKHGVDRLKLAGKQPLHYLAFAVIAGIFTYTVHRSLIYPVIEGLLDWKFR